MVQLENIWVLICQMYLILVDLLNIYIPLITIYFMKIISPFIFVLLISVSFVSAQYYGGYGRGPVNQGGDFWYGTEQFINSLVYNIQPILRALFGGYDWTGYLLFEKFLLFILIAIIVGIVLENLPVFKDRAKKGILRLVAVIIALLGVRWLSFEWLNTILVQYQALFITIAGVLPFMIYWYFVKGFDAVVRKFAWALYGVIYLGLWITAETEAYESVYLWGAIVALIYAFFIDEWFERWMQMRNIKISQLEAKWGYINEINEKIEKLQKANMPDNVRKRAVDNLDKQRESIIKSLG